MRLASPIRRFPEPESMRRAQEGVCKWCGRAVAKPSIYWHRECFADFCLFTRAADQKAFLLDRDGRRCVDCPADAAPALKWQTGPVEQAWSDAVGLDYWPDQEAADEYRRIHWPRSRRPWTDQSPLERMTGDYRPLHGRECALEVDHEIPLWAVAHLPDDERRPFFGPLNLRLRCPMHHKAKTAREAALRAAMRKSAA